MTKKTIKRTHSRKRKTTRRKGTLIKQNDNDDDEEGKLEGRRRRRYRSFLILQGLKSWFSVCKDHRRIISKSRDLLGIANIRETSKSI